jgi:replicative DNA helicase
MTLIDPSIASQFDRLPPHSVEAEQATLGAFIAVAGRGEPNDEKIVAEVRAMLTREDFYQADHQIIFDVLCAMHDGGRPVDAVTLRDELRDRGLFEEVGGKNYLATLLSSVPGPSIGPHYANIVRTKSSLRKVISHANDVLRDAYAPYTTSEHGIGLAQKLMEQMAAIINASTSTSYRRLDEILSDVRAEMTAGGIEGIKTGFFELDDIIGEIGAGEEMIVAARPSMGKSLIAKQIALHNAINDVPFAIVSLEERDRKIGRNLLAGLSGIDNHKIRKAKFLAREEWVAVDHGIRQASGLPLFIVDKARKVSEIRAALSVLKARHGIRGFVLDYLGRVRGVDGKGIYEQVTNASGAVSDMIKDLKLSGIVLSQLSRAVENREDKRPNMSDLRDSGAIEQDADGILFLHREDYYHLADEQYEPTRVAEVIVGKLRDGERGGVVKLQSNLRLQRFENLVTDVPMFQ